MKTDNLRIFTLEKSAKITRIKCAPGLSIISDVRFSKQLYLTRFWTRRSMDRREYDTHISTHARVVQIVVVAAAIEKNSLVRIRFFISLINIKILYISSLQIIYVISGNNSIILDNKTRGIRK